MLTNESFLSESDDICMDYHKLLEKYNALLEQVDRLTKENNRLKAQLGLPEFGPIPKTASIKPTGRKLSEDESAQKNCFSGVDCTSDSLSKIRLFMLLFKGREDVYAKQWENKSKGKSGYAPVCLNEWQPRICEKPKISCSKCNNKAYAELNEKVVEDHLRGNTVIGIYPMLPNETRDYLSLPRGCEVDLLNELDKFGIVIEMSDKTFNGKPINVEFKGQLREEQALALSCLLQHDTGILSGTTAFGKTVVAIKMIGEKKINTLILVNKISLLSQWKEKLTEFLEINETMPEEPIVAAKKRGRKKIKHVIGQIGAGKDTSSGIIDIAVMQSLNRRGEVKECVKNYGLVIADECHHASAFTYEQVLKATPAKFVYGLTATPTRKDGHHPILVMHCGPIRYRDNPKKQAENRRRPCLKFDLCRSIKSCICKSSMFILHYIQTNQSSLFLSFSYSNCFITRSKSLSNNRS